MVMLAGCSDNDSPEPQPVPEPEPETRVTDLSAEALANCYIVAEPGYYTLKADNQFNLGPGLPVPPKISPASAKLVWQSEPGLIASVELTEVEGEPYVSFEVGKARGNALLAVVNADGEIEWSWHIWMPEVEIESLASATGYDVMNLNLGALNNQPGDAASYGMLYQWGRKDPFPAAPSLTGDTSTVGAPLYDIDGNPVTVTNSSWFDNSTNTIEYAIANPTVVLSNYSQFSRSRDWLQSDLSDDALWGNPLGDVRDTDTNSYVNKGMKTCYDPSPAGWRVAPVDAFRDFTSSGGYAWDIDDFNVADINGDAMIDIADYNYGWHFNVNVGTPLYFPAAARYDGSYAMLMGSVSGLWGSYWSNSPYSSINGGAFCALSFQVKGQNGEDFVTVSPSGGASRADAYSIRCVRDTK